MSAPRPVEIRATTPDEIAPLAEACGLPAPSLRGTTLLAAWSGAALVGYLELRQVLDEAELLAIGVAPAARRQGVGAALMGALLAAVAPPARVFLEVRAGNAAAQALYVTFGFTLDGRRARYYRDGEDAALYSLAR